MYIKTLPDESKVILVGKQGVGKTCISDQFNSGRINPNLSQTIGASFIAKAIPTKNGPITMHVWDTAGQERYRSLIPLYARNSIVALLVFDVTDVDSYNQLFSIWIDEINKNADPNCIIYLVANKIDLPPQFNIDDCEKEAKKKNFRFKRISALDNESVNGLFQDVAETISLMPPSPSPQLNNTHPISALSNNSDHSSGCC